MKDTSETTREVTKETHTRYNSRRVDIGLKPIKDNRDVSTAQLLKILHALLGLRGGERVSGLQIRHAFVVRSDER
jgi:hypothetical protein